MNYDILKSGRRPHAKLAAWISEPSYIYIIQESKVAVDAEVEVGGGGG